MQEFEITFFNKKETTVNIVKEICKKLKFQKYTITFQKIEGRKFVYQKYLNFKSQKINFFNRRKLKISNYNLTELIEEIRSSLELFDISSDSINKVLIEEENNYLFILISKYNSHGQGNASISDIKPKSNSLHLMFKIEPIIAS